jgi:acetylornithine/N-succinyldiaminopimelate aminotransferase
MSVTQDLLTAAENHLYPNYGPRAVVLERGQGSFVWDSEGRRYLDLYAGIAVSVLGHAHPALTQAICEQAGKLLHQTNYFLTVPNVRLASLLCELTGMQRAFFCNSGTEANEAALKLVRRYFYDRGQTDRFRVIAFDNAFHGRTLGALSVTGQSKYKEGFGPVGGVTHVPFGDLEATARALGPDVAAIITEPIQAEGGIHVAPPGFLAGLRRLASDAGAFLILDEIQTGMARTGSSFLYSQSLDVRPDVVTMAKALGGGVPIGAMLCDGALAGALPPGSHGTTFGGNPLASAAALATLTALLAEGLSERSRVLGEQLTRRLDDIVARRSAVVGRRGVGLLQGLVLADAIAPKEALVRLREAGVLVTLAGTNVIRFTPALTIDAQDLDAGLDIVDRVLGDMHA